LRSLLHSKHDKCYNRRQHSRNYKHNLIRKRRARVYSSWCTATFATFGTDFSQLGLCK
jgi:hypothetical protein